MIDVLARTKRPPDYAFFKNHPLFGPEHRHYSRNPTVGVTRLHGGPKVDQIPDTCRAQVDIRMIPGKAAEDVLRELGDLLAELRKQDPDLNVSIRSLGIPHNRGQVELDHPAVGIIQDVCPYLALQKPPITGSVGGGRASLATLGRVMHCRPGGGPNAHFPNEYAVISRLLAGARLYGTYARAWWP